MRSMMTALVAGVFLCAPMAAADEEAGDYARDGGYLAMGSLFSWDTDDVYDLGYGLNVRSGWRHSPHLATEILLDVVIGRSSDSFADRHEIAGTFNDKVPILTGRVQPYAAGGMGIFYSKFDGTTTGDSVAFVVRAAAGVDLYATPHWVLNVESVYQYPTPANTAGIRTPNISISAGVAYRF